MYRLQGAYPTVNSGLNAHKTHPAAAAGPSFASRRLV